MMTANDADWKLVDRDGKEYNVGDRITVERKVDGERPQGTIAHLSPPHRPGTSGKVTWTEDGADYEAEYYASVFGLTYVRRKQVKLEQPKPSKKAKAKSRTARWQAAASEASSLASQLRDAIEALKDVQQEYSDWQDNLPENFQSSALAEKLETVCNLEFDTLEGALDVLEEAESIDLPMGFGRD
jgi:hypothetical protein